MSAAFHRFYQCAAKKQIPQSVTNQFKECEAYMLSDDLSKQWKNFQKETEIFDEMRNESVDKVLTF